MSVYYHAYKRDYLTKTDDPTTIVRNRLVPPSFSADPGKDRQPGHFHETHQFCVEQWSKPSGILIITAYYDPYITGQYKPLYHLTNHCSAGKNNMSSDPWPLKLWCSLPSPPKVRILESSKICATGEPKKWSWNSNCHLPTVTLVLVNVDIPVGKFKSSYMSEYNISRRLCVLLSNDLLRVVDWINGTLLSTHFYMPRK